MKFVSLLAVMMSVGCAVASEPSQSVDDPALNTDNHVVPGTSQVAVSPHLPTAPSAPSTCFFQDQYVVTIEATTSCSLPIVNNVLATALPGDAVKDPFGNAVLEHGLFTCNLMDSRGIPSNYCGVENAFECVRVDSLGNVVAKWNLTSTVYYNKDGTGNGTAVSGYDPIENRNDCQYTVKVALK